MVEEVGKAFKDYEALEGDKTEYTLEDREKVFSRAAPEIFARHCSRVAATNSGSAVVQKTQVG